MYYNYNVKQNGKSKVTDLNILFRDPKLCFPYHNIGYDEVLVSLQYLSEVGQLWIIYGCI